MSRDHLDNIIKEAGHQQESKGEMEASTSPHNFLSVYDGQVEKLLNYH